MTEYKPQLTIDKLDDLSELLTDWQNSLTSGDMPDEHGICFKVGKGILFLERLKLQYAVCDICGEYIPLDSEFYTVNDETWCHKCHEEL